MMKRILAFVAVFAFALPAAAQQVNGRVTAAAPSYTANTSAPLSLDENGNLRINFGAGASLAVTQGTSPWVTTATGNVAGAAVDSGNPVKIGCKYNTTTPTYVDGNRTDCQADLRGNVLASLMMHDSNTPVLGLADNADAVAVSATTNALKILARNSVFNGTTWDRLPGSTLGMYGVIRDAAGNARGVNVTAANEANVIDPSTSATASAVPAKASYVGANSAGNLTGLIQASASAAINVSTATTTQLVALSGSTKIYVTSFDVISGGTGNITFVYGTGASCGTGTTSLTGAYNLTAQAGIAKGNGLGPVLVVPAGNALCVTTSAAVQMSGSVAYTQF
jgi:hypothetical protein